MMARVHRLRTKSDRLRAEQARWLRDLLREHGGGLPERAVGEILLAIDRNTEADDGDWGFVMLWADKFDAVCDWLEVHSRHPQAAPRLFRKLLKFMDPRDQRILLTRQEMADLVGVGPDVVSTIMNELLYIEAMRRDRVRVPGMRGPGVAQWYLNPRVGTNLPGKARDKAQAGAPPLRLDQPKRRRPKLVAVE